MCIIFSGLAYVAYAFMLTPFFSSPQLANQVGVMLHILPAVLFYIVQNKDPAIKYGLSVFPQVAALVYINQAAFDAFPNEGLPNLNVNKDILIGMLAAEAIVFFLAFAYFDQVLPNEFGISKHWLWLCKKKGEGEDGFGRTNTSYDPRATEKRASDRY